jgi:hypothetical protein
MAQNMNETEKSANECVGRTFVSSPIVECFNVRMAEGQTSIESWEVQMADLEETEREISKINEQLRKKNVIHYMGNCSSYRVLWGEEPLELQRPNLSPSTSVSRT